MAGDDERDREARARVGAALKSKWTLESLLGVGGVAAVYAARHRNGGRAAIKLLHHDLGRRADVRARFLREGYASNSVGHPGVVRVIDDDEDDQAGVFLIMDLVEGETLEARWQRRGRRLGLRTVLRGTDQLLDILECAHDHGIVHRDLKPSNILVANDETTRLLDFGIARMHELTDQQSIDATQQGALLGSPAFMAPEQARGDWAAVDARTDLWAVGAIMFTMLAGRYVHQAPDLARHLFAATRSPAPPLLAVRPDVPATISAVVDRALAFDKATRWGSARMMRAAIREAHQQLGYGRIPEDPYNRIAKATHDVGTFSEVSTQQGLSPGEFRELLLVVERAVAKSYDGSSDARSETEDARRRALCARLVERLLKSGASKQRALGELDAALLAELAKGRNVAEATEDDPTTKNVVPTVDAVLLAGQASAPPMRRVVPRGEGTDVMMVLPSARLVAPAHPPQSAVPESTVSELEPAPLPLPALAPARHDDEQGETSVMTRAAPPTSAASAAVVLQALAKAVELVRARAEPLVIRVQARADAMTARGLVLSLVALGFAAAWLLILLSRACS